MKILTRTFGRAFLLSTLAFLLFGCGGSQHPRAVSAAATANAPQFIELRREVRANTLHFPAGIYSLSSADKIGYYYRAPRKIVQHAAGTSMLREGGIFVSKGNREKLRGYIFLGGAVTQVGNFSHADYAFRAATPQAEAPAEGPY